MKTTPADGCRDTLHTVYQRRSLHGSLMMQKADGGSEETRQVENPGVTESSYSGDTGHTQLLESQEKAQQPALGMSAGRAAAGPGGSGTGCRAVCSDLRPHRVTLRLHQSLSSPECPALVVVWFYCCGTGWSCNGTRSRTSQQISSQGKWFSFWKEQGAVQSRGVSRLSFAHLRPLWQRPAGNWDLHWRFTEKRCSGRGRALAKGQRGI